MNRENIIRRIVERDVGKLGLAAEKVQQEEAALYNAACEQFGTWETALQYAGIREQRISKKIESSEEQVLREIRKLCLNGSNISSQRIRKSNRRLYKLAKQYFGTWQLALVAMGINMENAWLSSKPRRLNKQQIIQELQAQHAAGLSLSWSVACLQNRSLAMASKNAFFTWRRALLAAGLIDTEPPPSNNRKWTQQSIIAAIKIRQQQGRSLSHKSVRQEENPLAVAAVKYFGGWYLAVAAAGFPVTKPNKNV